MPARPDGGRGRRGILRQRWQFNYALDEDVVLQPDDVIRVECSWDRSLVDPSEEPHWVSWAEGTEDEMCYSTVATRVTEE